MAKRRLCKNKKTGAIFVWNEKLRNDPDIVLLTPDEEKKYYSKLAKDKGAVVEAKEEKK